MPEKISLKDKSSPDSPTHREVTLHQVKGLKMCHLCKYSSITRATGFGDGGDDVQVDCSRKSLPQINVTACEIATSETYVGSDYQRDQSRDEWRLFQDFELEAFNAHLNSENGIYYRDGEWRFYGDNIGQARKDYAADKAAKTVTDKHLEI